MDNATAVCAPGVYYRARWIAKDICSLKIFGFRDQLQISQHEMDSLRRICVLASAAPANNLQMLQLIELYAHVDIKIAKIAKSKISLLLWFLSEDLAALPLFGSDTTIAVKKAIVNTL